MREDLEFQSSMQKIEELIGKLEHAADPATRAAAKELVAALMEVHGGCLARMLEVLERGGEAGQKAMQAFQQDGLIRNLLILYELHPVGLEERATQAVEQFVKAYSGEGMSVKQLSVEDGIIRVRYASENKGCGAGALKPMLEARLLDAAPDAAGIYVEDANEDARSFVPVIALKSGGTLQAEKELHGSAERA
jgi:hypothetical protein